MVERSGADGVWASGLEISASRCVPDTSIVTMTEHLDAARSMCFATVLPVVADCDTGYGNAANVAHAVSRFEAAGVAGICIEDKRFPKRNSFAGGRQELVGVDEFADKIRAGKKAQQDESFVLIARVEALIAGGSREQALERAHAYAAAGADAVLIHSKSRTPDDVAAVARAWDRQVPLVVVPTTYSKISAEELEALGVKVVIYANQGLRSALRAMEETYAEILRTGSTESVEPKIWPLESIFELQEAPARVAEPGDEGQPWRPRLVKRVNA